MSAENNPSGSSPTQLLQHLGEEARRLADSVGGPLRRLVLRAEGSAIELEWDRAAPAPAAAVPAGAVAPCPAPAAAGEPAAEPADEERRTLVRSPMVGTFYHAPAPGEPPFVSIGSMVEPDTVVGIVEAMKLMNQITAGLPGVVNEVLVANACPVEFEQPLIALDPVPDPGATGR